jgi:putative hydrolase of the HAD superfamily
MIKVIFWDFFGVINIDGQLNPEVAEFIKLNKDKYKFAILSASNVDLHPWLQQNAIDDCFDLVQITKELGMSKTAPSFYKAALDKLNTKAHEVLFVDDIESYLNVAKDLGINTLLYDSSQKLNIQINRLL